MGEPIPPPIIFYSERLKKMKLNRETKERIQFMASLLVLLAGIVLVFIGLFLQPVGVIHYTVLSAFGMFLTFVGAVWQLDVKYTYKTEEMRSQVGRDWKRYERLMQQLDRMEEEEETDYENPETL